jgi:secernin
MCDTIVALPASVARRTMLFGKNSDRQRNEAQTVELFTAAEYASGSTLRCTYMTLPQVRRTHQVLLCRPFWVWGAEMGANEHGVAIGNEAMHARSPSPAIPALTGMDLVRLALERAHTAAEAIETIAALLEAHGQGGNCGHIAPSYYNNGFIIADATEAFVMETVDREWLVERVEDVRALSNTYSIQHKVHRASSGLRRLMREFGWRGEKNPSYAQVIADPQREHIGNAAGRYACGTSLLRLRSGELEVADMMSILRDHGRGDEYHSAWRSTDAGERTLCMHAGDNEHRGQTVGSLVSELKPRACVHWVTGTAAPCMSIFKPVLMDAPLPPHGVRPTDHFDRSSLWWRHERLHRRALLGDMSAFLQDIGPERDAVERGFRVRIAQVLEGGTGAERADAVHECWAEAMRIEETWCMRIRPGACSLNESSIDAWREMNRMAEVEDNLE